MVGPARPAARLLPCIPAPNEDSADEPNSLPADAASEPNDAPTSLENSDATLPSVPSSPAPCETPDAADAPPESSADAAPTTGATMAWITGRSVIVRNRPTMYSRAERPPCMRASASDCPVCSTVRFHASAASCAAFSPASRLALLPKSSSSSRRASISRCRSANCLESSRNLACASCRRAMATSSTASANEMFRSRALAAAASSSLSADKRSLTDSRDSCRAFSCLVM
ncbi:MAG: hypothetical protein CAPSK01_004570 [Candidatus Accumulibacter vicinus]|uniref:Uncharacterized protein n=1 Tax=Candidatus Accumulibacter vicinus TaxID=2954382 RepID=A0A084XUQ7_9PROT|nr:MAG: hypothetical protein CAPSK01_004570 [Candidatus Accumulibacter vicinus]